ncbi:hypothetical protein CUMW_018830 [Citrus unshiu]|nr:hypothetical protein CUMW_018830 [Citrus unshiu]
MAAPPQARQSNKLVRVGKEAFSLLDETYGSPKESGRMLSSTQPRDPRHEDPGLRKPLWPAEEVWESADIIRV